MCLLLKCSILVYVFSRLTMRNCDIWNGLSFLWFSLKSFGALMIKSLVGDKGLTKLNVAEILECDVTR